MVSPGKRPARDESADEQNSQDSSIDRAVSFSRPLAIYLQLTLLKLAKRVKREKGLARPRSQSAVNGAVNGHAQPSRDGSVSSSDYSESDVELEGNGQNYDDDEANIRAYEAAKAKNGSVYGVSYSSDSVRDRQAHVTQVGIRCRDHQAGHSHRLHVS